MQSRGHLNCCTPDTRAFVCRVSEVNFGRAVFGIADLASEYDICFGFLAFPFVVADASLRPTTFLYEGPTMDADSSAPDTARLIPLDYRLRMPGPTTVPERVRQAMALPIISHRGPEFRRILGDSTQMLRTIIGTQDDIFFLGTSGTGGMEAALANVLSPGDVILVIVCGQFGERFVNIAHGMGGSVDQAVVPWGEAPDTAFVAGHLKRRNYRAVVCVHNESSTGVVTDIAAIGKSLSGTDTLLIVELGQRPRRD